MKIAYILPGLGISGGVAVVLNHVNELNKKGYEAFVVSLDKKFSSDKRWAGLDVPVVVWDVENEKFPKDKIDIAIATHFSTVRIVNDYIDAKRKIYFVQSDERRFDLNIEDFFSCQKSYLADFEYMTMAKWIQKWLKEEFGHNAYYVPNGLDEKIFFKTRPLEKKGVKKRVLLEGPINIPFKGMQDAYDTVKDLDCELWIISSFGKPRESWRYNRFFESVPMNDMSKIYSSCDIFLKMSNVESFSYPPLEAMACGCVPIVKKVTGIEEYAEHKRNCIIVNNIIDAKLAVKTIINDNNLRGSLLKNGFNTAKLWSWDRSIDYLEKVIKKENVEIFYSDSFPEKYDYNKIVGDIKDKIIFNTAMESRELREELLKIKKENDLMKSFYFWKLRNKYIYLKEGMKFLLFHPEKFIIKHWNKLFGKK